MRKRRRKRKTRLQKFWSFAVHELEIFKFIFLVGYIMLGGFLFASKEASKLEFSLDELDAAQDRAIERLNEIDINVSILKIYENSPCKFGNVRELLKQRAKDILQNFDLLQKNRTVDWSYGIAMYYSFVQITTIGYGDFVPMTMEAKLLTVLYTAIGIPMCISVFFKLGNLFSLSLYNCWKLMVYRVKRIYKKAVSHPNYTKNPRSIHISFLINVNFLFIAFCACVLPYFSKLSYIDSYYFFVITMSTIGFGDIYPSRSSYWLVIFLTCFGIGLTATLFSNIRKLVQTKIESSLILYINNITRQADFKRYRSAQLGALGDRPQEVSDSVIAKEISSSDDVDEEEVYVVDFERCFIM